MSIRFWEAFNFDLNILYSNLNFTGAISLHAHKASIAEEASVRTERRLVGNKNYEFKDHLGNVRLVTTDLRLVHNGEAIPELLSYSNYYPFGMMMPGRNFSGSAYRYGFNGMEKDDEISGSGNSYTAEYWQYDSRLGRRWNIDPVYKHYLSNYLAFGNNPIFFVDPDGDDWGKKAGENGSSDQYKWFDGDVEEGWDFVSYHHDFKLPEGANALNSPDDFKDVKTPVSIMIVHDNEAQGGNFAKLFKENVQMDTFGDPVENNWRVIDVTELKDQAVDKMDAMKKYYGDRIESAIFVGHGFEKNTEIYQQAKIAYGSLYKYPQGTVENNIKFLIGMREMVPVGKNVLFVVCYSNKIVADIAKTYFKNHNVYGATNMEANVLNPTNTVVMSASAVNTVRSSLRLNLYQNGVKINTDLNFFEASFDRRKVYFSPWEKTSIR